MSVSKRKWLITALMAFGAASNVQFARANPVLFSGGQSLSGSIDIASDGAVTDYNISSGFSGFDYTTSDSTLHVSYTQGGTGVTEFEFTAPVMGGSDVLYMDAWFASPSVLPNYFPLNTAAFGAALASLPNNTAIPLCSGGCTLQSPGLTNADTEQLASGQSIRLISGYLNFSDPPSAYTLTLSATPVSSSPGTGVPEPTTLCLLIPGLLALSAYRVRLSR